MEIIPNYNLYMMCKKLNKNALSELNSEYHFRNYRPDELEMWKALHFDSVSVPLEYEDFMSQFVQDTYSSDMDTFYNNTIFACTEEDVVIGTCSYWKAYGKFNSIHWLKTRKGYEGKGIGRAMLSKIMKKFQSDDYPVFIHTQPSSFKAIKLYSDFGFKLLSNGPFGSRKNELEKCLPILKELIPKKHFESLEIIEAPDYFIKHLENETTIQF